LKLNYLDAPWCGACKAVKPRYEKAASLLEHHIVRLAKVDATKENTLATKFEIKQYPTFLFFDSESDKHVEYSGSKRPEAIVEWVKNTTKIYTSTIASVNEFERFRSKFNVVSLGLFKV
jgi:protein disulfide-isomerase-like protein